MLKGIWWLETVSYGFWSFACWWVTLIESVWGTCLGFISEAHGTLSGLSQVVTSSRNRYSRNPPQGKVVGSLTLLIKMKLHTVCWCLSITFSGLLTFETVELQNGTHIYMKIISRHKCMNCNTLMLLVIGLNNLTTGQYPPGVFFVFFPGIVSKRRKQAHKI